MSVDSDCASAIRDHGWWQGAVVDDATLRSCDPDLPEGWTYWIAATQTCNLFSDQFERINLTEWVGASEAAADPVLASGSHPRQFQCVATLPDGGDLILNCNIQARHWSERRVLASFPPVARLFDELGKKRKDHFIGWLARSYTRLELSDELNLAIEESTIGAFIKSIVRAHKDKLYGIFLNVDSDSGASPTEIKPCEEDKCGLEIVFVANTEEDRVVVEPSVVAGMKVKVANPQWGEVDGAAKQIPRADRTPHFHVLATVTVRSMADWTAADINGSIRYSFSDYFSDSAAAA